MRLNTLEASQHWRATVEYQHRDGQQTICLMESTFMEEGHCWFVAECKDRWLRGLFLTAAFSQWIVCPAVVQVSF